MSRRGVPAAPAAVEVPADLTLRGYYAGCAMQALVSAYAQHNKHIYEFTRDSSAFAHVAAAAYKIADEMLKKAAM